MSEWTGAALIFAERIRQILEEGWSPSHDAEHDSGELVAAAICYASLPEWRRLGPWVSVDADGPLNNSLVPEEWPWAAEWWKPTPGDRVRELTKAGALIAAEIDRLLRRGRTMSDIP